MSEREIEYTVVVHEEDGSYWAEVPVLPGCFASGDTLDELREAVEEAIALCRSQDDRGGDAPPRSGHMSIGELRVSVPA
jgi:predicted RNase H-like HicB family nuclease